MNYTSRWLSLVAAIASLCVAIPAQAYVGPGAGVTLIGALVGLVSAIGLALWAVIRWPIRRLLARRKAARDSKNDTAAEAPKSRPD